MKAPFSALKDALQKVHKRHLTVTTLRKINPNKTRQSNWPPAEQAVESRETHLCALRAQLLAKQLGVSVADVLDLQEPQQPAGEAHHHVEVGHLLHTGQHQHALLDVLEGQTTADRLEPASDLNVCSQR